MSFLKRGTVSYVQIFHTWLVYVLTYLHFTWYIHCQNVWSGWPVYEVKCLCSRGQEVLPLPPAFQYLTLMTCRPVASAPPVIGRSVNPISTRGAHYPHPVLQAPPPGFSSLPSALNFELKNDRVWYDLPRDLISEIQLQL